MIDNKQSGDNYEQENKMINDLDNKHKKINGNMLFLNQFLLIFCSIFSP